jgi:hemolysin D
MSAWAVFKDAWQNRHTMGDDSQTRELAAFLPAALEIEHAPANPLAKWLGRTLIFLFVLGLAWAMVGEVNIVASAEGKIIPSSRVKQIQPLEKAVVKAILVREGQTVVKGQALIELDSALTDADEKRLASELQSAELQLAIKQGFIDLLAKPDAQDSATKSTMALVLPEGTSEQHQELYKNLMWQQWQQYQSQRHNLHNNLIATRAEQAATREVIKKLQQTLPMMIKRTQTMAALYAKRLIPETEHLELEQQRIEQTQDLAAEKQRLKQLKANEAGVNDQLNTLIAQTTVNTLTEVTELQRQRVSLQEELVKATDLNAKQMLYAPVSGQIQDLAINTVGGVVMEAQQLMLIVPDEQQLEVEVFLENKDIGFVQEGMAAEIKIHTFPFTKYGLIEGEITTISDDATIDEQRGLIYGMHLLMKKNTIFVKGKEVRLMPGMAVTAEVKTGERRIIEFFLAPLLRYKEESIRER